jgi:pyrrolidone-carboxylate peptidase
VSLRIILFWFRNNRKNTHNSSVKSNALEYRDSEIDDELAYKFYKKKMGVMDIDELEGSDEESSQRVAENNQDGNQDDNEDDDYSDEHSNDHQVNIAHMF